jgi:hypothetical protein
MRALCPTSPGCNSTLVLLRMIDRLKIKTVEVLLAKGLSLLNSVECFPVIHCPSLASKKNCDSDLEIGHPRFRALGCALHRAGLGQQIFAALAAVHPKGALDLGHPSKMFSQPIYLI